jgi:NAD(P)-dependent dehydrogenase (short-subunit alcohol dehydrogenase family)
MDFQLQGKHILITGGSKGIGLACAKAFLQEGAKVSLVSRDIANLTAASDVLAQDVPDSRGKVFVYSADLRNENAAAAVVDQTEMDHGPIDILVNSAGAAKRTPPDELTPMHWHEAMDAKYFTYIHAIDPVVKRMAKRGTGVILNIIGQGGKMAKTTHIAGGAANAALMLATAGLAAAYGPKGVRVNAINPGLTLTSRLQEGLTAEARMNGITIDEALNRASAPMPLGRLASPEDIANAVVFLCSARASYISGSILSIDGAAIPMVV